MFLLWVTICTTSSAAHKLKAAFSFGGGLYSAEECYLCLLPLSPSEHTQVRVSTKSEGKRQDSAAGVKNTQRLYFREESWGELSRQLQEADLMVQRSLHCVSLVVCVCEWEKERGRGRERQCWFRNCQRIVQVLDKCFWYKILFINVLCVSQKQWKQRYETSPKQNPQHSFNYSSYLLMTIHDYGGTVPAYQLRFNDKWKMSLSSLIRILPQPTMSWCKTKKKCFHIIHEGILAAVKIFLW